MRSDVDFETLVREHLEPLYRFARSLTRQESDARDLVQETFLRWAQRGHQLTDVSRVKAWLFTTLYRESAARSRRSLRFPHESVEAVEPELPELPPEAPRRTDGAFVLSALEALEEHFRAPVALFYLEDYSYPEIAEILDVPVGTVKSRI
ncbi:MAG: RNA polymerase sigma factor, partial [Verrucomicrobiales bacterium]|nr:RNA polymerase sigma factor [Verrucomicrobiales bacterium]